MKQSTGRPVRREAGGRSGTLSACLQRKSPALFVAQLELPHGGGLGRPLVRRLNDSEILRAPSEEVTRQKRSSAAYSSSSMDIDTVWPARQWGRESSLIGARCIPGEKRDQPRVCFRANRTLSRYRRMSEFDPRRSLTVGVPAAVQDSLRSGRSRPPAAPGCAITTSWIALQWRTMFSCDITHCLSGVSIS
jgi:hypothetical protein